MRPRWRGSDTLSWVIDVGLSRMIEVIVEIEVSPLNGRSPVAIWYRTTPSEKTSERASAGLPSACSGAM